MKTRKICTIFYFYDYFFTLFACERMNNKWENETKQNLRRCKMLIFINMHNMVKCAHNVKLGSQYTFLWAVISGITWGLQT